MQYNYSLSRSGTCLGKFYDKFKGNFLQKRSTKKKKNQGVFPIHKEEPKCKSLKNWNSYNTKYDNSMILKFKNEI